LFGTDVFVKPVIVAAAAFAIISPLRGIVDLILEM
jgi:hypothetical protein